MTFAQANFAKLVNGFFKKCYVQIIKIIFSNLDCFG